MSTTPPEPHGARHARRFVLRRHHDVTGVSGTGDVADGVLWPDGTASVRWRGEHPSVVHWDRGRLSVETIHGHGGATEIVWLDDDLTAPLDTNEQPSLALRRVIDLALTAPVPCPDCGRPSACPCRSLRSEQRLDAVTAAVQRWLTRNAA